MRAATTATGLRSCAAILLAATGTLLATPAAASAAPTFTCVYKASTWPGGFSADLAVANHGPTVDDWLVRWSFPAPTTVLGVWTARIFQPDPLQVTATSMPWNRTMQ